MLDFEDQQERDAGGKQWAPVTLECTGGIHIGPLPSSLIAQSGLLSNMRSFDATTTKITVDADPNTVELVLRFSRMVIRHNQLEPDPSRRLPIAGYFKKSPIDPVTKDPPRIATMIFNQKAAATAITCCHAYLVTDHANRGRHIALVLGGDPMLGEFVDMLSDQPILLLECMNAARVLMMEPAFTAFELKWACCLYGLSPEFMDLTWPTNADGISTDRRAIDKLVTDALRLSDVSKFCPRPVPNTKIAEAKVKANQSTEKKASDHASADASIKTPSPSPQDRWDRKTLDRTINEMMHARS
jgi:hypothetical protein